MDDRTLVDGRIARETVAHFKEAAALYDVRDFSLKESGGWYELVFDDSLGYAPAWNYAPRARYDMGARAWRCRVLGSSFLCLPCPFHECLVELRGYLLAGNIAEDAVVVDAGPWSGITGLALAGRARKGRVLFLEPDPDSAELLRRQVELNGFAHAEILQAALSDASGSASFRREGGGMGRLDEQGGETVRTVTLAEVLARTGFTRVDFLKLDVEGAEVRILKDLARFVQAQPQALVAVASYHEVEGARSSEILHHALGRLPFLYLKTAFPFHETTFLAHRDNAALVERLEGLTDLARGWELIERARLSQRLVKRKVEVEEADRERVHGPRAGRPALPGGDVLFLAGVPGSGRGELGRALAERLDRPFLPFGEWDPSRGPAVVAADEADLSAPGALERARSAGLVFYLQSDARRVAARLAGRSPEAGEEELLRAAGARIVEAEPVFLGALHFLLPEGDDLAGKVESVLERMRL